jgi:dGTPase
MDSKKEFFQNLQTELINRTESNLSPYATKSTAAIRNLKEVKDARSPFSLDRDRILYSGAFRR